MNTNSKEKRETFNYRKSKLYQKYYDKGRVNAVFER